MFTPGPYRRYKNFIEAEASNSHGTTLMPIAEVKATQQYLFGDWHTTSGTQEDNVRLFQHADELYHALRGLVDFCTRYTNVGSMEIDTARAVLKKVDGAK